MERFSQASRIRKLLTSITFWTPGMIPFPVFTSFEQYSGVTSGRGNPELSQKRAGASADYSKARISTPSRTYSMGYGETKLLNGCACEGKYDPKYTEEQHQENRRTEFLVIRF